MPPKLPGADPVTDNPATALRRSADLVEQRAKDTTPGPWEIEYSYGGDTPQALFVMDPDYPDDVDQSFSIGCFTNEPADNAWAALVHPGVAAALAAWLRHTANAVWTYPPFLDEWKGGGDGAYHAGEAAKAALTLARVLLGEDQP